MDFIVTYHYRKHDIIYVYKLVCYRTKKFESLLDSVSIRIIDVKTTFNKFLILIFNIRSHISIEIDAPSAASSS